MSLEDYEFLQDAAVSGKDVLFDDLEKFFPAAFRRLKLVGDRLGKDYRSLDVIRHYFLIDHNEFIDKGDGTYKEMPASFCEFCKVKRLPVLEKKHAEEKLFLRVEKERWVQAPFFDDIELGEEVTVHHALAVEKVKEL